METMTAPERAQVSRAIPWLVLVAVVLVGFNLRGPMVAIAPVIDVISRALGLSAAEAGLLTSLPVLCFALVTPLASVVIGRAGPNVAVSLTLAGVILGTIIRSIGTAPALVVGTVVLGLFITIGNVVMPVVIRRDFPVHRVGIATGTYTAALNVGSTMTTLGTAPLAAWLGWQAALNAWLVLALAAGIVWTCAVGWRSAVGRSDPRRDVAAAPPVTRRRHTRTFTFTAVLLALAFGGQAFGYYGMTAWLPQLLAQEVGLSREAAGVSSSFFQLSAVVGALGVPLIAHRVGVHRTAVILGVLWATVPVGLATAPHLWGIWTVSGGIAQGGGITILFTLVVMVSTDARHARRLSAFVQGVGYSLAALSPTVVGATHDATGGWTVPMIVVGAGVFVFIVCTLWAALRSIEWKHRF